jgi:1,4-dihydroxy-2-naphthoyl-CoA hydrolase
MDTAASMQKQFEGGLPALLGIQFIEVTREKVVGELIVRADLCTLGQVLHGGAIMAFADTLGAVATIANLPADTRTTTIESKTNFLSAAPLGSRVVGESTPVHRGRTTMVWQTQVRSDSGRLVALVIQTQMVLSA